MVDGTPMKWRASSQQQHFDSFYEDVFLELTKFGIVEGFLDSSVCSSVSCCGFAFCCSVGIWRLMKPT